MKEIQGVFLKQKAMVTHWTEWREDQAKEDSRAGLTRRLGWC